MDENPCKNSPLVQHLTDDHHCLCEPCEPCEPCPDSCPVDEPDCHHDEHCKPEQL